MNLKKKTFSSNSLNCIHKDIFQGSITVEAAFVMPIIILTTCALIYLAFYLHDTCRIQSVTDLALHKASLYVKHEGDITFDDIFYNNINDRGVFYLLFGDTEDEKKQITDYIKQELSGGLFLIRIDKVNVDVGKQKLSVSVGTETKVTLPGIKHLFKPYSSRTIEGEYPIHNPAETIRCTEVILETGSSIKGVDTLKEKFEKILGKE